MKKAVPAGPAREKVANVGAGGYGPHANVLPDEATVRAFKDQMPEAYREAFDDDAIRTHAALVLGKPADASLVELWRHEGDVSVLCIVADDRPGLLARVTEALVVHAIDVVAAQAYGRLVTQGSQAVDFLWVRKEVRLPGLVARSFARLEEADVAKVRSTVDELVRAMADADAGPPSHEQRLAERPEPSPTVVRFETDARTGATTLTVEAVDRPGLLLTLTQTLFRAGVQITGLRARTEDGLARDRLSLAELDGKPLSSERRFAVQIAVLAALEEGVLRS